MGHPLYVNVNAANLANALVRSPTDLTPVGLPTLVIGDRRDYDLYFVDGDGFVAWSGTGSYTPLIGIGECANPSGGTFTLTYSGQTTAAIAYNASPAAVQAALEALSNLAPGDVTVTGVAGVYYKVVFGGTLAATNVAEITGDPTNLTPSSVVSVDTTTPGAASPATNEIQLIQLRENPITYADDWTPIANGWTGTLSTRTLEIAQALAAESPIVDTFQITVEDPDGNRRTYLKKDATIECTIIDPESFAGADKPTFVTAADLAAAALAGGVFTREALTSSATGNTNVTRPAGSHYHTAVITVSGTAGTRTLSALTTNSPAAGDRIRLFFINPTTAAIVLEVRNATSGGTLLKSITTDTTGEDYFVDLVYSGSAWEWIGDNAADMKRSQNLAGLANIVTSRQNLGALFARISDKSANYTVLEGDDGTLFRVTTSTSLITLTLPAASDVDSGWAIVIRKADGSTGSVVTSPATETLSGQGDFVILISDGSTWTALRVIQRTNASHPLNLTAITGLTGGGATNLDGLTTADARYPAGTVGSFYADSNYQHWRLYAGTNVEDAPNGIVLPDDYNAVTNAFYWQRIG